MSVIPKNALNSLSFASALLTYVLFVMWVVLLFLPSVTTLSSTNTWDYPAWQLSTVTAWLIAVTLVFVPWNVFIVVTLPIVIVGTMIVGADLWRNVNLLELLAVLDTFSQDDINSALAPYANHILALITLSLLMAVLLWNRCTITISEKYSYSLVGVGVILIFIYPPMMLARSWPINILSSFVASNTKDLAYVSSLFPNANTSPRPPTSTWNAHRAVAVDAPETYVLVIGESIRADRLRECGGRQKMHSSPEDSLVFCNVVSGSSSTHTSVPLLISREMPGISVRVPHDATFLEAFNSVGFDTYWLAVQSKSITWPDATHEEYLINNMMDREILLPKLDSVLSLNQSKKMIVLHAINAHSPYASRYRQNTAPFSVDRSAMGMLPSQHAIGDWWNDYDNAVDESVRFVSALIDRLRSEPGNVFFVFTPDHGENMLDDKRALVEHALTFPTKYDTHVPMVIWANSAWRDAKPDKWQQLTSNIDKPLMHIDVVPTLLGAADIQYDEPRARPVDLTSSTIEPKRQRTVQQRLGVAVSYDDL